MFYFKFSSDINFVTHSKSNSLLSFEGLVNLNLPTKSDKKAFDNAIEMIVNRIVTAHKLAIFGFSNDHNFYRTEVKNVILSAGKLFLFTNTKK